MKTLSIFCLLLALNAVEAWPQALNGSPCEKLIKGNQKMMNYQNYQLNFNAASTKATELNKNLCDARAKLDKQRNNPELLKKSSEADADAKAQLGVLNGFARDAKKYADAARIEIANKPESPACIKFLHEQEPGFKKVADAIQANYAKAVACK